MEISEMQVDFWKEKDLAAKWQGFSRIAKLILNEKSMHWVHGPWTAWSTVDVNRAHTHSGYDPIVAIGSGSNGAGG
jgi:hypothetical protein